MSADRAAFVYSCYWGIRYIKPLSKHHPRARESIWMKEVNVPTKILNN